jgi:hypothetical protein
MFTGYQRKPVSVPCKPSTRAGVRGRASANKPEYGDPIPHTLALADPDVRSGPSSPTGLPNTVTVTAAAELTPLAGLAAAAAAAAAAARFARRSASFFSSCEASNAARASSAFRPRVSRAPGPDRLPRRDRRSTTHLMQGPNTIASKTQQLQWGRVAGEGREERVHATRWALRLQVALNGPRMGTKAGVSEELGLQVTPLPPSSPSPITCNRDLSTTSRGWQQSIYVLHSPLLLSRSRKTMRGFHSECDESKAILPAGAALHKNPSSRGTM